jgi:hypothetical protein
VCFSPVWAFSPEKVLVVNGSAEEGDRVWQLGARVQKVGEYCKIFGNSSAAKVTPPSKDLADTIGLKLLHCRYLPVFG